MSIKVVEAIEVKLEKFFFYSLISFSLVTFIYLQDFDSITLTVTCHINKFLIVEFHLFFFLSLGFSIFQKVFNSRSIISFLYTRSESFYVRRIMERKKFLYIFFVCFFISLNFFFFCINAGWEYYIIIVGSRWIENVASFHTEIKAN